MALGIISEVLESMEYEMGDVYCEKDLAGIDGIMAFSSWLLWCIRYELLVKRISYVNLSIIREVAIKIQFLS